MSQISHSVYLPSKSLFSSFWLSAWAIFLAVGWLLPNHYWPWSSFQTDLWVAVCFTLSSFVVFFASKQRFDWHWLTALAFFVTLIPFIQFYFGLIFFSGEAWLYFLFLLGFALSLALGDRWESLRSQQAIDGLFLAIGIAALGSVIFQLSQWLGVESLGIWLLPVDSGRPYANFAQPNNLGTFLVWGIIASGWGFHRRFFNASSAVLVSVLFVFGIALTQSRTALCSLLFIAFFSFYWRNLIGSRRPFYVVSCLLLLLLVCYKIIPVLSELLLIPAPVSRFSSSSGLMQDGIRLAAYGLFLNASFMKPWFGYGLGNVGEAFFAAINNSSNLGIVFYHSHNLFLDLILWMGWPVGFALSLVLLFWAWQALRMVRSIEQMLLLFFVGVVIWHAMLELPLHYAYFLLPTGLVMGVINAKNRSIPIFQTPIGLVAIVPLFVLLLLGVIGYDYLDVEQRVLTLRLERLHIQTKTEQQAMPSIILNQFDGFLLFSRAAPKTGMSEYELKFARYGAMVVFNPLNSLRYIETLALNNKINDAQLWVEKMRKALPERAYKDMAAEWNKDTAGHPSLVSVAWPAIEK